MSPFPAAQSKLTQLARLLLRHRGRLARLCPIQVVTHGRSRADHAAPERGQRATPTCRRWSRWVPRGPIDACAVVGVRVRTNAVYSVHGWVRTDAGTGPAAEPPTMRTG